MSETTENRNLVPGTAGGLHVAGAPLTTTATRAASPDLLVNSIDRRIVRINPSSTPIDQISRIAGTRHASSMVVQYYSVDTKPTETTIRTTWNPNKKMTSEGYGIPMDISVEDTSIFEVSETVLIPDAIDADGCPVVVYITEICDAHKMMVMILNPTGEGRLLKSGIVEQGKKVIRMGRAAGELDVQTPQFQTPTRK